jgi:hypothetical protein
VIEARDVYTSEQCPTECLETQVVGSGVFNEALCFHTALSHETITCQETAETISTLSNVVSQHAASRNNPFHRTTPPFLLHFLAPHCCQISSQCGAKKSSATRDALSSMLEMKVYNVTQRSRTGQLLFQVDVVSPREACLCSSTPQPGDSTVICPHPHT